MPARREILRDFQKREQQRWRASPLQTTARYRRRGVASNCRKVEASKAGRPAPHGPRRGPLAVRPSRDPCRPACRRYDEASSGAVRKRTEKRTGRPASHSVGRDGLAGRFSLSPKSGQTWCLEVRSPAEGDSRPAAAAEAGGVSDRSRLRRLTCPLGRSDRSRHRSAAHGTESERCAGRE